MRLVLKEAPDATKPLLDVVTEVRPYIDGLDHTDDDLMLEAMAAAATKWVERYTRRALLTQTWTGWLDEWPCGSEIRVPKAPLSSVTHVKWYDTADVATTLSDITDYREVTGGESPGRIVLRDAQSWPSGTGLRTADAIEIEFVAGYGATASTVPEDIVHAAKALTHSWYTYRGSVAFEPGIAFPTELTHNVRDLLNPHRIFVF